MWQPPQASLALIEMDHLRYVLNDLKNMRERGEVTERQIASVVACYEQRYAFLYQQWGSQLHVPQTQTPPPAPVAEEPPRPAFSTKAFVEDNSILLLSYVGGFLLIVATLLFELYGTAQFSALVRLGGIAALTGVFAAITRWCWGRQRFGFIARTYLAVTALLVPLTMVAAYELLALQTAGLSRSAALTIGGTTCAILYGALAVRLKLHAYAGLALLASFTAWEAALSTIGFGDWAGVFTAILLIPAVVLRYQSRSWEVAHTFKPFAGSFCGLIGVWAIYQCALTTTNPVGVGSHYVPATFLVLALGAGLSYRLMQLRAHLAICAGLATMTTFTATWSFGLDQQWFAADFVVLGWLYAIAARFFSDDEAKTFFRVGAAVQLIGCLVVPLHSAGLETLAITAGAAGALLVVLESRQWYFLFVAVGLFVFDWYWILKAVVPPPPNPGPSTLALAYSPLPVVLAGVALLLRLLGKERLRIPPLMWSVAVAAWVLMLATVDSNWTLVGWSLLGFAAVFYLLGVVENQPRTPLFAGPMVALGILALQPPSWPNYWTPLIIEATGLTIYILHIVLPWERMKEWQTARRIAGLGIMGATAICCLGVPGFFSVNSPGAVTSWITSSVFAIFLAFDGYLHNKRTSLFLGIFAFALSADWLTVYAGYNDPQGYIDIPSLAAIGIVLFGRRSGLERSSSDAIIATAATFLLGTTFLQSTGSFSGSASPDFYVAWLLVEGVGLLLVGIGFRTRMLLAAGGAGAGLAALRAIFEYLAQFPSYVTFAVVAMVLLGLGALLAAKRDQVSAARSAASNIWSGWN